MSDTFQRLLLLGGTPRSRGGVEVFSERAVKALRDSGITVQHLPTQSAYLRLLTLPLFLAALMRAGMAARRERQVWLQYGNLADLIYLGLALLPGVRVVVTPHLGSNWRSQSNSTLRWLARIALSKANTLALISPIQEEELDLPVNVPRALIRTFLPEALAEITPAQPLSMSEGPLTLIHAGRLSEGKGTLLVLDIARLLVACEVDFRLELVGSGDAVAATAIEVALADPALSSRIGVTGHLDEDALLAKLATADILLHLSKVDSFPLIVLEALGCGAYPICWPLPGANLMVNTYTGSVVEGRDPVSEAVKIIIGFDRGTQRVDSKRAGVAVRSHFSKQNAASDIASVAIPGTLMFGQKICRNLGDAA